MRYYRLKRVAIALNISTSTIIDFLNSKGFELENKPTTKISEEQLDLLVEASAIKLDKSFKESNYSESSSICKDYSQLLLAIFENDERLRTKLISPFEFISAESLENISISVQKEFKESKDKIAFFKRLFKRAIVGFKLKQTFVNLRLLFISIITPRLFHIFSDEEDINSVAQRFFSLSIGLTENLKEACLIILNIKTRLSYEGKEFTYRKNSSM